MTKFSIPTGSALLLAFTFTTGLVACRTTETEDTGTEDLVGEWSGSGIVEPDQVAELYGPQMTGAEFLELNKQKDGVVVLPSGLQYRILDQGNGEKPELEDSVMVHYKMINLDGEVVDDTRRNDGKPQSYRVARVIGGWREALVRMPEGSRWKLYVPPDLGFGSTGIAGVNANETLIYEIELFKVKKVGPPSAPDLGNGGDVSLDPLD